jgi:hypothetical protein
VHTREAVPILQRMLAQTHQGAWSNIPRLPLVIDYERSRETSEETQKQNCAKTITGPNNTLMRPAMDVQIHRGVV